MTEEGDKHEKDLKDFYEGEELVPLRVRRKDVILIQQWIDERRTMGVVRRKVAYIASLVAGLTVIWQAWPTIKKLLGIE